MLLVTHKAALTDTLHFITLLQRSISSSFNVISIKFYVEINLSCVETMAGELEPPVSPAPAPAPVCFLRKCETSS